MLLVEIRQNSDETTDEVMAASRVSIIGLTATVFLADANAERVVDLRSTAMTIKPRDDAKLMVERGAISTS
jgi:hypothetical protein